MLLLFSPSQGQQEKRDSQLCTIHGYSERLSAMLWFGGCPCRWCSVLSDSVPLGVMLEFRLVSPTWDCAVAICRGQTLSPSHKNSVQTWPLQRHHVPGPVPWPCCGCKPFSPSGYFWCCVLGMVRTAQHAAPPSQLCTLCFCTPLGASSLLQGLLCWRIVHAGSEWATFFAWPNLVVAPRVCSPSSLWLDVLLLVLITTLCCLGKNRWALPIFGDQLLCLTSKILLQFPSVFIFSSALKQNCLLIVFQFAMKHCSKPFPLTGFQRV